MSKLSLDDIERKLLMDLKTVLVSLYPNGKVEGREFVLGSVAGEVGTSLKLNLSSGLWGDFSQGQSGRILKFFALRNGSFAKGLAEVRQLLKIPEPPASNRFKRPKKDWLDDTDFTSKPFQYLIKERKIPRSVLSASRVKANETDYIFVGVDEEGKPSYAQYIGYKRIDGGKKVRFSPGENKAKLCLWGMHSMTELMADGSVIITEGVIDAMTFRAADLFAVSIPSGILNTDWIAHSWNWLAQFKDIYLCFDYDEAGQSKLAEIAGRLGIHRCKQVILPSKDANEVWVAEKPEVAIQLLKNAIEQAKDLTPEKRVTARDMRSKVDAAISEGPIQDQGQLLLGWYFEQQASGRQTPNFRFRPAELTIWSGYPGGGKSTVLFQHLAHCIFVLGQTVAIASLEEPAHEIIAIMITQALGYFPKIGSAEYNRAYDILNDRLIIFNELGMAALDEVLEFFEYSARKDGATHCVLDSLMCTDLDVDGDKNEVNQMNKKILQSLNKTRSHYHIVAHCTKGNDEDWKELPKLKDVKGIQEITARAYNVIFVWRNKVKENSIEGSYANDKPQEALRKKVDQPDTIIKIAKNRKGKVLGQIKAWFALHNNRFRPDPDERLDKTYLEEPTEDSD